MGVLRHPLGGNFQFRGVIGVAQGLACARGHRQIVAGDVGYPALLLPLGCVGHAVVLGVQHGLHRLFAVGVQGAVLLQQAHLGELHLEPRRLAVVRVGELLPQEVVRGGAEERRQLPRGGELQPLIAAFVPVVNGGVGDARFQGERPPVQVLPRQQGLQLFQECHALHLPSAPRIPQVEEKVKHKLLLRIKIS